MRTLQLEGLEGGALSPHILLYITIVLYMLFCYIFYPLKQFPSQNLIFIDMVASQLPNY